MRKKDEISRHDTCLAQASPEEMIFVLLGRDPAAPYAIRCWAAERIRLGKNTTGDEQIVSAIACADTMEAEGRKWADEAQARMRAEYFLNPDGDGDPLDD